MIDYWALNPCLVLVNKPLHDVIEVECGNRVRPPCLSRGKLWAMIVKGRHGFEGAFCVGRGVTIQRNLYISGCSRNRYMNTVDFLSDSIMEW